MNPVNLRTNDEIRQRVMKGSAFLGFDLEVILPYADEATARDLAERNGKPFAKDEKLDFLRELTSENVIEEMRDYASFGWEKVHDHRGLSASRTIIKMQAWMWLLGDDEGVEAVESLPHQQYGAPALNYICKRYDFPVPDDTQIGNMIQGKPCFPDCDSGCGW